MNIYVLCVRSSGFHMYICLYRTISAWILSLQLFRGEFSLQHLEIFANGPCGLDRAWALWQVVVCCSFLHVLSVFMLFLSKSF